MILALIVPLLLQAQRPAPQRDLPDPGVVATGQRVTPAGVQTVFNGRVAGVRFGENSSELWVAVPGSAYKLDWRANRVIARGAFDGRPGVQSVVVDRTAHRVLVSTVGRLPAPPGGPRPGAVSLLSAFAADAAVDPAPATRVSPALGASMAGAPAVASRAGPGGRRIAVVPLPANDSVAVLDADKDSLIGKIGVGVEPIAAVVSGDGTVAYVSIFGGPKPGLGERAALQVGEALAEPVRVDAAGVAERGAVSKLDLVGRHVVRNIIVGLHPTALAWDTVAARLYVANGNSDAVTVIDTRTDGVLTTIALAPFKERKIGLAPTALALSPDRRTLFVALGGANAVAVYDIAVTNGDRRHAELRGLIPTGWYPASLDVSDDGRHLAVGTLFGVGAGNGSSGGLRGRFALAARGAVNVLEIPTPAQLTAYSTAVSENNRLTLASGAIAPPSVAPRANAPARAVPERPGEASLIRHVVFIVKENRTYDQVLGDLDRGARDSTLVMYGRDVTPNTHALSQQFVTLDHFFATGGNSADGHQWLTQANETAYPMWPLYYGRSYPSEGIDALTYSSGGFLWDNARKKGKSVVVFGEYAPAPRESSPEVRAKMMEQYRAWPSDYASQRGWLKARYDTHSDIPSLDRELVREYPGWTQEAPDVVKAGDFLAHLADWETKRDMPNLVMLVLPNDHTEGTSAGWCTPAACVADNDLALGKIVEGLSHSTFWHDMAILVVEDDAQNGVDHIDGHRTVALAISPYTRRGIVDSTFYSQQSMVKTVELMLGLPAMSLFDLVATDMRASFVDRPNLAPYAALVPKQSLTEVNVRVGAIRGRDAGARRVAARASARMRFDIPDAAPSDRLNVILWHAARGWSTPFPGVRRSLFFPMSMDLSDEEREEKDERGPRRP